MAPVGSDEPEWSPRGDALFCRQDGRSYSVGPEGRFLVLLGPPEQTTNRLEVITDIFPELRRLAPQR